MTEFNLSGQKSNNQAQPSEEREKMTQETEQLEQQQSEPENPKTTAESSQIGDEKTKEPEEQFREGPDWDNIKIEEPEEEPAERPKTTAGQMAEEVETVSGSKFLLGYDVFHSGFCKALQISGHILRLKTLKEAPERGTCAGATKCLYDIILDTPALHFLLQPESIYIQRGFLLGSFFVPLFGGCAKEMKSRKPEDSKKKGWFA